MLWCPQWPTAVICMRPSKDEEAVYEYHCWGGVVVPYERRLAHHVDGPSLCPSKPLTQDLPLGFCPGRVKAKGDVLGTRLR